MAARCLFHRVIVCWLALGGVAHAAYLPLDGANGSGVNVTATGGTAPIPIATWMSYTLNPKAWNSAIGDGKTVSGTYSITSGAAILTAAAGTWTAADVGKGISVPGAGAAAAALNTTILSFQSVTQITLAANASTTLTASAASVAYGTDAFPAFNSLITSVSSGKPVLASVPAGVYYLGTAVTSNGRIVTTDLAPGASVIGPGIIFVDAATSWSLSAPQTLYAGTGATANGTVGPWVNIKNTGTAGATGRRTNYVSNTTIATGFDVSNVEIDVWAGAMNGGQGQGLWQVAISPNEPTGTNFWGVVNMELDTSFRGLDTGWHATRFGDSSKQWTGGIQIVAESSSFGQGGNAGNALFAYGFFRSAAVGPVTGIYSKIYNGILGEPDAIAPDGRGIYVGGDSLGVSANYPHTPFQFSNTWKHGIRADTATLVDGNALIMSIGQNLAWITGSEPSPTATATVGVSGSGANISINLTPAGTGTVTTTGDTVVSNGRLTVGNTAGSQSAILMEGPASITRQIVYRAAGVTRWTAAVQNTESGSNVGSDWSLFNFTDGGSLIGTPLKATRSTGIVTIGTGLQLPQVAVASLPTCNGTNKGLMVGVNDATTPTYNGTLTGGGAVAVPAYCNGAAWTAH